MKKYEIAYHNYAEAKCAHQVQKWLCAFGQKKNKTPKIKTICNNIFTYLRHKKVQSPTKKFKELFILCSMKWNRRLRGLTMFVFSFSVESLELSVKLGRLVIFDFLGNCLLWTPLFPNRQPNCPFTVAKENLIKMPAIVLLENFQRIQMLRNLRLAHDWLSVSFFVY